MDVKEGKQVIGEGGWAEIFLNSKSKIFCLLTIWYSCVVPGMGVINIFQDINKGSILQHGNRVYNNLKLRFSDAKLFVSDACQKFRTFSQDINRCFIYSLVRLYDNLIFRCRVFVSKACQKSTCFFLNMYMYIV